MISASEIRRSFLNFFAENGHQIVPSSPLIPKDDPSLLFTNAGMVQFKKVFLGQEKRGYNRATTSQKCLRVGGKHNDLENVGRTSRHHTFFEMLGSFSFGDYFKEEAIKLAWDYLTKELELTESRLYITVFNDDDEALDLWKRIAQLPDSRIYRLDKRHNFWAMGDTGPCGPCSEILIDQGEHLACGPDCEIGVCECDRYLEIWNLVFMQFERDDTGNVSPLPRPSIDTGMGLERIAAVCQGVYSNFDTDLFSGLLYSTSYKAGVRYGEDPEKDTALRVIADHSRAVSFMIADGILPANEGRGYVLRRLIRRAFRFGSFLGLEEPFLHEVCGQMVGEMGEAYPELVKSSEFIAKVVCQEEENFGKTLDKGLNLLNEELKTLKKQGKNNVPGEVIFKLYDTFGFPVDIVRDLSEKQNFEVDEQGFDELMQDQKKRSKETWTGSGEVDLANEFSDYLEAGWQTEFVGYEVMQTSSRIVALMDMQGNELRRVESGKDIYIVTARTPFYGESGGQVGDKGRILSETGMAKVVDTLKPALNFIVHKAKMVQGSFFSEQEVNLHVNEEQRMALARNHTCTHLLHAALRKILGEHVKQSGSLVSKERLRFDFTHITSLTAEELQKVEEEVNLAIFEDKKLIYKVLPFEQAKQEGALGLFTEKYQEEVRVVEIPGISKELCGGTHLKSTGQAGIFVIMSETGIASGIRRIEGTTAWNVLKDYRKHVNIVQGLSARLRTRPDMLEEKVLELQEEVKTLHRKKEELESRQTKVGGVNLLDQAEELNGYKLLATKVDIPESAGMKGLRNVMDNLRSQVNSGTILLAAEVQGKAMLLLYVSKNLQDIFTAPEVVKEVAALVGGSGGGRPDLAQAGGSRPEGIDQALSKFKEIVEQRLK